MPTATHTPSGDTTSPDWRLTLRWADAPDVLTPEEAGLLARCGANVIYDILTEQRIQLESGMPPVNPLPTWRRGQGRNCRIRIRKTDLWRYLEHECATPEGNTRYIVSTRSNAA